ncbi:MAG: Adenylate cyclase [Rhodanobacteraceae bacterium]|nr:MAG: Adenylate cyclase [Rhodanobacteraceae bacterium]
MLRAGVLYAGAAWAFGQGLSQFSPALGLPDYATRWFLIAAAIGFPFWLAFAWFYEFTPQGFRRDAEVASDAPIRHSNARKLDFSIIGVLAVAVVLLVTNQFVWRKGAGLNDGSAAAIPAKSIAVLPFENLSTDKANAYFADGMQDMILTKLADIGDLKVIARTSTEQFASHPEDLQTIAGQLGVATLLEGSVQKSGNEVLINVQLIDARTRGHIWAQSYQRTLDNVFGVEGEVAGKIADALHASLTRDQKAALARVPTENAAAWQAYLKALELGRSTNGSAASMEQVIDHLQTAVELDPHFTLAWTELMWQELGMYWYGYDPTQTRLDAAKAALDRAETLAPDLPQVKLARANYMYRVQLDFAGSLSLVREVLPAVPNESQAWYRAALAERRLGQWDASMRDMRHAQTLDPLNNQIRFDIANSLLAQHEYAALLAWVDPWLSAHPDDMPAREFQFFVIWNLYGLDAADQVLASLRSQASGAIALRAHQASYRRDYKAAADLFARAIADADADEHHAEFFVGSYLPASVGWRLWQALNEQRAGADAQAAAIYRGVQAQARAALAARPVDPYVAAAWHSVLGLACAGLGQRAEAVVEGQRAVTMIPESKDAYEGPLWVDYLAQIYAMNGDAAHAVPLIGHLLQTNGSQTTPALLRFDPVWDPIRNDARFQALLKQYANNQSAATGGATSASSSSSVMPFL